jgi:hypothetical protein
VLIFNYGPNNLVVAVDTGRKDGFVDQWFVLQTLAPVPATRLHLAAADVHFEPKLLRVISHGDRAAYDFAMNDAGPGAALPAGYTLKRTTGYGLAHNVSGTEIRLPKCENCESLVEDQPDTSAGASCDSGGPGAMSCSVTSGKRSCFTTCPSGFYACCTVATTTVTCRCVGQ